MAQSFGLPLRRPLGYLDEDGYVHFVGREAHWIRRRGENVSAFEVEKAITAHEAVVDCACVGVPSERVLLGEEDIKAYVQVSAPAEVKVADKSNEIAAMPKLRDAGAEGTHRDGRCDAYPEGGG